MATSSNIVICTGFAQGLRLICKHLLRRGVRTIAVEDPWHNQQRATVRAFGFRVIPIPVDEHGIRVDLLRKTEARAVIVTPAHQYPTGAVLSASRRSSLIDWACLKNALVIEDDYDAEYRYDREPIGALQGLAPDRVVYCGSASKILAPGLRLGWILLPADMVSDVASEKHEEDLGSPVMEQVTFADFINRGELDRHLRKSKIIYRRKRDLMIAAINKQFPSFRVRGVAAGLHLMVELPSEVDESALVASALEHAIGVYGVRPYRLRKGPPALILGYGALSELRISKGIQDLRLHWNPFLLE
jgi:GntR family transcriptional regulator/MocR family aminotransferase